MEKLGCYKCYSQKNHFQLFSSSKEIWMLFLTQTFVDKQKAGIVIKTFTYWYAVSVYLNSFY